MSKDLLKKTVRLKMRKKLNHVRLVTNNERAKKIGQVQTRFARKCHQRGFKNFFKRTTPGIPTWSPTVVLAWPDSA